MRFLILGRGFLKDSTDFKTANCGFFAKDMIYSGGEYTHPY
jgi:hypothetical protein